MLHNMLLLGRYHQLADIIGHPYIYIYIHVMIYKGVCDAGLVSGGSADVRKDSIYLSASTTPTADSAKAACAER